MEDHSTTKSDGKTDLTLTGLLMEGHGRLTLTAWAQPIICSKVQANLATSHYSDFFFPYPQMPLQNCGGRTNVCRKIPSSLGPFQPIRGNRHHY